jgi:hypothetical protein
MTRIIVRDGKSESLVKGVREQLCSFRAQGMQKGGKVKESVAGAVLFSASLIAKVVGPSSSSISSSSASLEPNAIEYQRAVYLFRRQ